MLKSGSIVDCSQGETVNLGQGGAALKSYEGFFKDL